MRFLLSQLPSAFVKILHFSIFDRKGGACIAGYRQHQALVRSGVNSRMWVRQKFTDDPRVSEFKPRDDLLSRTNRVARRFWLRGQRNAAAPVGELFSDRSDYGGAEVQSLPPHDLINIQFTQDFVDLPAFYSLIPASVPVVVTLHEMSMFTGGCSYAYSCRNFERKCGDCPLLANDAADDISARSWRRKRIAYTRRPAGMLHFVADSHWLATEARKSSLLKNFPVEVIHYGLDTDIFRPQNMQAARELLGLPQGRPIVAFAAASVTDERKGVALLAEAIKGVREIPFLLTWGAAFPKSLEGIPHLHLGAIDSEHLVSIAYNASDFFVIPSLEEAFGQTCLEAMACGRPVVGFDVGGIPDMIRHNETGLLVPRGDVEGLTLAIQKLIDQPQVTVALGYKARAMVQAHFSFPANADAYRKLYERLIMQ